MIPATIQLELFPTAVPRVGDDCRKTDPLLFELTTTREWNTTTQAEELSVQGADIEMPYLKSRQEIASAKTSTASMIPALSAPGL